MILLTIPLLLQAVGDTIWVERFIATPPGWTVRAAVPTDWGDVAEALSPPQVVPAPGGAGWTVRYAVAAWTPDAVALHLPPVWRLAPDGTVDSVPREWVTLRVASVLPPGAAPESLDAKPALPPAIGRSHSALPVVAAAVLAGGLLAAGLSWRRRGPRPAEGEGEEGEGAARTRPPRAAGVPDARWIASGEYRAVAARAMAELRLALAAAVPDLSEGLSVEQCAARLEASPVGGPVREIVDTLRRLEQAAFAAAVGADVAALAAQARRLAEELPR